MQEAPRFIGAPSSQVNGERMDSARETADERGAKAARASEAGAHEVDYAHRHFVNLAATALLLLVATLGVWTIKTIDDQEALRKCLGVGRKDCVKIAAPPKGPVQPVR